MSFSLKNISKKYFKEIIILCLLSLGCSIFPLISPLLMKYLIDTLLTLSQQTFYTVLIVLILVYIFSSISLFFNNYLKEKIRIKIFKEETEKLLPHITHTENKITTGDIISRLTNNLELIINLINNIIPRIFLIIINLAIPLLIMFFLNKELTLIILSPVLLFIIFASIFGKKIEQTQKNILETNGKIFSYLKEIIRGKEFIKIFGLQNFFFTKYNNKINTYKKQILKYAKYTSLNISLENFIMSIPTLLLLIYGSELIMKNELTIGSLLAFMSYIYMFFSPINEISNTWIEYKSTKPAINRINEIYIPEKPNNKQTKKLKIDKGIIQFNNVTFSYTSKQVLKNINITFKPGLNYIIGENGSGKTTILKLISRIYDCDNGEILIDGQNINNILPFEISKNIGLISSDPYLFEGTIYENIQLDNVKIHEEDIIDICKKVKIHDFITKLPHKYDTLINEEGLNLSSGEKQKISLARILLKNPKIILLDEFSNSIDRKSLQEINICINSLKNEKTIVIVDHNLKAHIDSNIINIS